MNRYKSIQSAVCVLALFIAAIPGFCAPPRWDLSKTGQALRTDINERIDYWSEIFKKTNEQSDVIAARKGLINDYSYAREKGRGNVYAGRAADLLVPLLNMEDTLKVVNVAIAMSGMTEEALQPALEKMNSHSNAAVRYYAARAYREIRTNVLARGGDVAERMFQALSGRAAEETSPYVLKQIFLALNLPTVRPEAISQSEYNTARKQALGVLQQAWSRCCRMLVSGRKGMAEACSAGLDTVQNLAEAVGSEDVSKNAIQMVANVTFSSAMAYDTAFTGRTIGESVAVIEIILTPQAVLEKLQEGSASSEEEKAAAGSAEFVLEFVQGSPSRLKVTESQGGQEGGSVVTTVTVPFRIKTKLIEPNKYWVWMQSRNAEKLKQTLGAVSETGFEITFRPQKVISENTLLLLDCEEVLNAMTKAGKNYIQDALSDEEVPDRGAVVRLAVLNWIEQLKGVSKPNVRPTNTTAK